MSTSPKRKQLLASFQYQGRNESRLSIMFRNAVATKLGVHVTDAECLDFLLEAGAASAGQLAKATGLSSSATTSMIDRLERAGYVQRKADPLDRRKIIVKPIPRRLKKGEKLYRDFVTAVDGILDTMDDDELETILKYVTGMSEVYSSQIDRLSKDKS
jgi:DNA-binding MarR family transcriptional regulator